MRKEAGPELWWKLWEIAESEGIQLPGDWSESEEETETELEEEEESEGSETSEEPEYCFGSSDSEDYVGEQEEYLAVFGERE